MADRYEHSSGESEDEYDIEKSELVIQGYQDLLGDGLLWKKVLTEGVGEFKPDYGMVAEIRYVGTLIRTETVYEDTRWYDGDRGSFQIEIGSQNCLPAFVYAIPSMKQGEKAVFIASHIYGYGNRADQDDEIPRKSALRLEVELLGWVDYLEGNGDGDDVKPLPKLIRERIYLPPLSNENDVQLPTRGAFVRLSYEGWFDGRMFDSRNSVEFFLGDGAGIEDLPVSVFSYIGAFQRGEKSKLHLDPEYAFGEQGNEKFGIPRNSPVTYVVHLLYFYNVKEAEDATFEESILVCNELLIAARKHIELGGCDKAIEKYRAALLILDKEKGKIDEQIDSRGDIIKDYLFDANLELAKCLTKAEDRLSLNEALETIKKALELEPNSVKAFLARVRVYLSTMMYEPKLARENLKKAVSLEPVDPVMIAETEECRIRLEQRLAQDAELAARMLGLKLE